MDNRLAAAKICELENEDELDDFMVEIDILSELNHENIITLYDAYYYQTKLWVSLFLLSLFSPIFFFPVSMAPDIFERLINRLQGFQVILFDGK